MKCLICKKEIEPFHIFNKKALFNKPVKMPGFGKTVDMGIGYCQECFHISSDVAEKAGWDEAEKTIYKELYDSWTPTNLSSSQKEYNESLFDWLRKLIPKGSVLEIGCYDGSFLNLFKEDGWTCKGVEPSVGAKIAKEKHGLDVIDGFFKAGQFEKNKFDLVIVKHVIEHVSNPLEFSKEAADLVKEGGFLYIEVPNSYVSLHDMYFPEFHVDHLSYFTIPSIEKLLQRIGGFEIIKLESTWAYMKFPFIHILAKKTGKNNIETSCCLLDHSIKKSIVKFKQYHNIYLKNLKNIAQNSKKTAIWGTGSCGIQFAIDGEFEKDKTIVIDPNLANKGKYLTVTGHLVHNPAVLKEKQVESLLVATGWEDDAVKQIAQYVDKKVKIIKFIDLLKS
ncbi:hypothetical protein AMJ47_00405 [Parcubacteria bacterium DG_72]|nr:MAG: hypothetical protein AMJ47_00405 [Parcubacteria bacterium DG_72]